MTTRMPTFISPAAAGFLSLKYLVVFANMTTTDFPSLSLIVTVSLPTAVTVPIKCVALPCDINRAAGSRRLSVQSIDFLNIFVLLVFVIMVRRFISASFKEFSDFLLLFQIRGTLRIQIFHTGQFVICNMRKAAHEVNELPAVFVGRAVLRAKRRHSREAYAIVNDVIELSVAQVLRIGLPHVRGPWIKPFSYDRIAASVVGMAQGAVIREMLHGLRQDLRTGSYRVRHRASRPRRGNVTQAARDPGFRRCRFVACAETTR